MEYIYDGHGTEMSDRWRIYMKKFTLAHKHPTIMKEWKAKNESQWNEYCDQIAALQIKNIDQVSEDDRTMLHDYVFLLTLRISSNILCGLSMLVICYSPRGLHNHKEGY